MTAFARGWPAVAMLAALSMARVDAQTEGPPVLSTVAEPPAGSEAVPAQMSGFPLQVGDLPPGVVVVRVIRRSFSENVAGQAVTLREPFSTRAQEAVTDADGRAQFSGMAVGARVQAQATLDGEVLSSQIFTLPAQGGVRLVLASGIGAGVRIPADAAAASAGPASGAAGARWLAPTRGAGFMAAVFALAAIGFGIHWTRRPRVAIVPPAPIATDGAVRRNRPAAAQRTEAFEALVRLEQGFQRGLVDEAAYTGRREELVAEILKLDAR